MEDFLSVVFDDLHLKGAGYVFIHGGEDWSARVVLPGRAVFHAVLFGEAFLHTAEDSFHLHAGDLFVLPTGLAHTLTPSSNSSQTPENISHALSERRHAPYELGTGATTAMVLTAGSHYDTDLGQPLMSALPAAFLVAGQDQEPPEWLRIGILFLQQEINVTRPGQQSILNRLGDIWFMECLRVYIEQISTDDSSWLRALKDTALAAVLSALHRAPEQDWTVPKMAALAHLSRSAFADRFHRIMGKPPQRYLHEHRMRLAAWQLRHSDQPVCRIAEMTGYASETAFGQAFKRAHGMAPGRYRQHIRKQ
ncbi:MAG: AraC family transcriptional regulator [Paraperlucidibaca sp.]